MKSILFVLMIAAAISANAQFDNGGDNHASLRSSIGYVYDFPGLAGTGVSAAYSFPLNEWLSGGIGVKHVQTAGYPRTATVKEFTKANALDFELLYVPLHTESDALRIGLNYTFSFYSMRRSYPVYTQNSDKSTSISWPVSDSRGRAHGTGLTAEYEHSFGDIISAGMRVQLTKAYDGIVMGGPFVGIRL